MRTLFLAILTASFSFAQLDQRLADLSEVIARKPDFTAAYYARAMTYLAAGRYMESVADLTQVISASPTDANAYTKRADAYTAFKRYDDAIADLNAALGIKPYIMLYLSRGKTYSLAGNCPMATADYTRVLASIRNVEAFRGRAACRRQLGDTTGAEEDETHASEMIANKPAIPQLPSPPSTPAAPITPATPVTPPPVVNPIAGGAYRIGGGVTQPSLLFKVEPEYSEEARKAKWQGTVTMSIVVDEFGEARSLQVTKALGLGLDEQAIRAVQKWVFKPARRQGTTVPVYATIEVTFHLL